MILFLNDEANLWILIDGLNFNAFKDTFIISCLLSFRVFPCFLVISWTISQSPTHIKYPAHSSSNSMALWAFL